MFGGLYKEVEKLGELTYALNFEDSEEEHRLIVYCKYFNLKTTDISSGDKYIVYTISSSREDNIS